LVGLALPTLNKECTENVLNALANLNLGFITDEPVRSSPIADIVLESVDKIAVMLHPIDIANGGDAPNKKNSRR